MERQTVDTEKFIHNHAGSPASGSKSWDLKVLWKKKHGDIMIDPPTNPSRNTINSGSIMHEREGDQVRDKKRRTGKRQPPQEKEEPHGGCQVKGPKVAKFLDR